MSCPRSTISVISWAAYWGLRPPSIEVSTYMKYFARESIAKFFSIKDKKVFRIKKLYWNSSPPYCHLDQEFSITSDFVLFGNILYKLRGIIFKIRELDIGTHFQKIDSKLGGPKLWST